MLHIRTILVPTDFSATAGQALDVARSLARDHRASLVLFAAVVPAQPTTEVFQPLPETGQTASPWAHAEHSVREQLAALAAGISEVAVTTDVSTAAPGEAIVNAARQHQADLIVMGTTGRSGLARLLLGSVAEHVLRHASCPVLTIKGTGERPSVLA